MVAVVNFEEKLVELLTQFESRLGQIERSLTLSVVKEFYTCNEVAERIHRSAYTVRQLCNKRLIQAKKVRGRGVVGEWRIPHAELERLLREGTPVTQTVS